MRLLLIFCLAALPVAVRADEVAAPAPMPLPTVVPAPVSPSVDMSGNWSGTWLSQSSGHKGPLNGTFTKIDDNTYAAKFRGRFFAVIPFRYSVNLNVVGSDPDHLYLSGSSRLPLFGTFQYSAVATPTDFKADYTAKRDRGQFNLQRR
ncbi:hypothetical protein [Zavarzinella formosa]|uniref:hypothetical protein n=1 Tax=Zavarzinella formosa TaxID=360055 RepID=UPI0003199943|nr:hypothetical protein [Zavarzinella formosa]